MPMFISIITPALLIAGDGDAERFTMMSSARQNIFQDIFSSSTLYFLSSDPDAACLTATSL